MNTELDALLTGPFLCSFCREYFEHYPVRSKQLPGSGFCDPACRDAAESRHKPSKPPKPATVSITTAWQLLAHEAALTEVRPFGDIRVRDTRKKAKR